MTICRVTHPCKVPPNQVALLLLRTFQHTSYMSPIQEVPTRHHRLEASSSHLDTRRMVGNPCALPPSQSTPLPLAFKASHCQQCSLHYQVNKTLLCSKHQAVLKRAQYNLKEQIMEEARAEASWRSRGSQRRQASQPKNLKARRG